MNIDILEFSKGYCQEFEKIALHTPSPAAALGGGLSPGQFPEYKPGLFQRTLKSGLGSVVYNTASGLGNIAGTLSSSPDAQGFRDEVKNEVVNSTQYGNNNLTKLDARGNVRISPKGVTGAATSAIGGLWDKAKVWMGEHPLMTGGIGAGLLSMLALPMLMGGNKDEGSQRQIVINNNLASTVPGRPIGPAFLNT